MKVYIPIVLFVLVLVSCFDDRNPSIVYPGEERTTIDKDSSEFITKQVAQLPVHFDSLNYIMHPVGQVNIPTSRASKLYKSGSSYGDHFNAGSHHLSGNLSNILFEHIDSSHFRKLTNKKMRINKVTFLWELAKQTKKEILVYEVIDQDSNKDGILDHKDVESLYLSTADGLGFTKVTNDFETVTDWKLLLINKKMYIRSIVDSNKDGYFDHKDDRNYSFIQLMDDGNFKTIPYNPID